MEMTLPIRSLHPIPLPPRSFANICSSLRHVICRRQTDQSHLPTLFATNTLTRCPVELSDYLLRYLKNAVTFPDDPILPALRGEIRESLLAMEAEAEHLGRETECNFCRAYFRTGRQRDEEGLSMQRNECLGRWLGLLQGWERACREYYDPDRDPAEVNVTARMGQLELE